MSDGTLLVDLHVHTRFSDGAPGIEDVERHCAETGTGAAITDHNEIRGSVQLVERGRAPTIPGIEVGTGEGLEFLVYFADPQSLERFYVRAVEPYLLPRFMVRSKVVALDCLDVAAEYGAFVSLAHPYGFGRKSVDRQRRKRGDEFVDRVLERVDAIEEHNGSVPGGANERAAALAAEIGKPVTGGSDAHYIGGYATTGVQLSGHPESTPTELFDALGRAGERTVVKGRQLSVLRTLAIMSRKHTWHFLSAGTRRKGLYRSANSPVLVAELENEHDSGVRSTSLNEHHEA